MLRRNNLNSFKRAILVSLFVFITLVYADTENESDILQMLISKFDSMQAKIVKLETSEATLKQSVGALIGTAGQFRLEIADLTEKLKAYEISDLEKDKRIKRLENEVLKIESKKDRDVNKDKTEVAQDAEDDETVREKEQTSFKRGIRQTPEYVAFSSYLDHVVRHLGPNQPIVYNMVLLNEGGAYSKTTGIFRVPVSGLYLFSWSVTARKLSSEPAYDIWVKLVVNGVHKVGAVAESQSSGDHNQGSNTVVLRLTQGDEVWTAHYGGTDIFGDDGERTTSLTGVLLCMN